MASPVERITYEEYRARVDEASARCDEALARSFRSWVTEGGRAEAAMAVDVYRDADTELRALYRQDREWRDRYFAEKGAERRAEEARKAAEDREAKDEADRKALEEHSAYWKPWAERAMVFLFGYAVGILLPEVVRWAGTP